MHREEVLIPDFTLIDSQSAVHVEQDEAAESDLFAVNRVEVPPVECIPSSNESDQEIGDAVPESFIT